MCFLQRGLAEQMKGRHIDEHTDRQTYRQTSPQLLATHTTTGNKSRTRKYLKRRRHGKYKVMFEESGEICVRRKKKVIINIKNGNVRMIMRFLGIKAACSSYEFTRKSRTRNKNKVLIEWKIVGGMNLNFY